MILVVIGSLMHSNMRQSGKILGGIFAVLCPNQILIGGMFPRPPSSFGAYGQIGLPVLMLDTHVCSESCQCAGAVG